MVSTVRSAWFWKRGIGGSEEWGMGNGEWGSKG